MRMRSALLLTLGSCAVALAARLIAPSAGGMLLRSLMTAIGFGVCAYLGMDVIDGRHPGLVACRSLGSEQIYRLALMGILLVAPVTLLSDIGRTILYGAEAVNTAILPGMQRPGASFLLRVMTSALLVPVCEEMFFRGYLLGALKRRSLSAAVWASSLCFALAHGMDGMVSHALLGALFALLMLRAESIFAPVLVHGCYNLTLILLSYAGLTPLFGRLTLVSCALRLAMCAGFVHALKRFYTARPDRRPGESGTFTKYERWRLIAAAAAVLLAALLALMTGVTG